MSELGFNVLHTETGPQFKVSSESEKWGKRIGSLASYPHHHHCSSRGAKRLIEAKFPGGKMSREAIGFGAKRRATQKSDVLCFLPHPLS